ncbi:CRISPR-associated protein Csh2 [Dyadobacter jejuensis]|uniref:CRISPR-associated protein Csh2 n=1 Tax=Dyadobacter jejuensis TaxID=1082580 RepID=A0A316AIZ9_9BACT|nr:type I-B CRISPR-associated protein Cas7/Csh2 [Dyadobacter jejuensis]PWJ57268.1 CRISPR-associated protein Csh2 [Dyadobacter jejuensis]
MSTIQNRSELLFLYDVKRCNPNGDPLDSNRPRLDEETNRCLVTDVRLKRTIRDYLFDKGFDGQDAGRGDIFIRTEAVTGEQRSGAYANEEEFKKKFIDVRLFGGVSAVKGKNYQFTGPVQFSMGYTINHITKDNFIKGTGAFATKEGAEQKTFREEYNITYGLVAFHGVINENAAKRLGTSDEDIEELTEAMWNGTKNLLTRSKKGHMPRLLVKVDYRDGFFIGDLCQRLHIILNEDKTMEGLEDVADYILDTSDLNAALEKYDDKIIKITTIIDDRIILSSPIRSK